MSDTPRLILHNDDTDTLKKWLLGRFPKADFRTCNHHAELAGLVAQYSPDAIYSVRFSADEDFPKEALICPQGPSWIANGGAGTDHLGSWDPARVTVTNAAGVAADMMAEYVLGGFLYFTLDVPGLRRDQRARHWNAARQVRPLKGKTLLIVGLGHTGRAVAERAKAFGMTVLGTRARPQPTPNVDEVYAAGNLDAALPHADFIAIATPLVARTRGLIGPKQFSLMKPGVVLVDVSRGGVIDQAALCSALRSGGVAGAALDVFETEPLPDKSPLWVLENVLLSPHCSAVHSQWQEASFGIFLDNLERWIKGTPLHNIVDPIRGY